MARVFYRRFAQRYAWVVVCMVTPGWCQVPGIVVFQGANTNLDQSTAAALDEKQSLPSHIAYDQGLLTIAVNNSSLAEILDIVRIRMRAAIEFPAAAFIERATVRIGPAPPARALAELLRGSPFDYLVVGPGPDPGPVRVILLEKTALIESKGPSKTLGPIPAAAIAETDDPGLAEGRRSPPSDETALAGSKTWVHSPVQPTPQGGDPPPGESVRTRRRGNEGPRYFPPLNKQQP